MKLFDVTGDNLDLGYLNLQAAGSKTEAEFQAVIEHMWQAYEPYADPDFAQGFARDVDARFWEMYLGCTFLDAGYQLLPVKDRKKDGGQPDLCVLAGERRIWIEAIAPDNGQAGPDQVVRPVPINEGGGLIAAPIRQTQLRTTHALWVKSQKMAAYLNEGVIAPDDIRIIGISASRFGVYVSEEPLPLIMTSVFPIGDQFVTIDTTTDAVIAQGYHPSFAIHKETGKIPRTAFLDARFAHISGIIWSRIGLGNLSRTVRPLTFVHNPLAERPLDTAFGLWDKEFVTSANGEAWSTSDILKPTSDPANEA